MIPRGRARKPSSQHESKNNPTKETSKFMPELEAPKLQPLSYPQLDPTRHPAESLQAINTYWLSVSVQRPTLKQGAEEKGDVENEIENKLGTLRGANKYVCVYVYVCIRLLDGFAGDAGFSAKVIMNTQWKRLYKNSRT